MKLFILIFSIAISNPAFTQKPDTLRKWSIVDCFQYATTHNIEINKLNLEKQTTLQDLSAARASKFPNLYGTIGNTFNNSKNDVSGKGELKNQLNSTGNYSLNSSVVLWNDNYFNNNIRQKELFSQSAGFSVQQSLNNITLQITQVYLEILLAKENLKYIIDLESTSEARVKQGQQFYDAGSVAKIDLLQLQAQFAGDKYLLVQTQNVIRQSILRLKQILQLPSEVLFDIITPDSIQVANVMPPLFEVQQAALQNFPEIKIGQLEVNIASFDIAKSRAGFKPVLSANGALGTGYSDDITNSVLPKSNYFTQTGNNIYERVGLTLSIPIYSNRINRTNLEKARIAFQEANLSLQNDQLVLTQTVEQAYLNAINSKEAYDAANEQLIAVTESYRIVNEKLKLGAVNTFDLLQQRNQYVQAVQAFTQAKYTALLQQKIYEFYMGKPVTL